MRTMAAIFLFLHGAAHLVGFFGAWRLLPVSVGAPRPFGYAHVPEALVRAVGVLWAATAMAFAVLAAVSLRQSMWVGTWSLSALAVVCCVSAALCLTMFRRAKVGLVIDLLIVCSIGLALGTEWFALF